MHSFMSFCWYLTLLVFWSRRYWLGEPFWGQGIMTECLKLVTEYAFSDAFTAFNESTPVERIQACVFGVRF